MTRDSDGRQKGRRGQQSPAKAGSGKPAAPKKGTLTGEDRDLWQKLSQSVEPLRRMKPRVAKSDRSGLDAAIPRVDEALKVGMAGRPRPTETIPAGPPVAAQKVPPPLAPFDRKRSRRIASGRIEIEARLDLQGARQAEAFGRFRAFLTDCAPHWA